MLIYFPCHCKNARTHKASYFGCQCFFYLANSRLPGAFLSLHQWIAETCWKKTTYILRRPPSNTKADNRNFYWALVLALLQQQSCKFWLWEGEGGASQGLSRASTYNNMQDKKNPGYLVLISSTVNSAKIPGSSKNGCHVKLAKKNYWRFSLRNHSYM